MDLEKVASQWGHLLTPEKQEFVQAYVVTQNVRSACEMIDLPVHAGKRFIKSPTVKAAIKFAQKSLREGVHVSPEEVISDLRLTRDMALGRIPVPETKWVDGEPVTRYVRQYNAGAANKAIENLGRVVGMFTDKKEISVPATDNQLKRRLEDILGVSFDDAEDGEIIESTPENEIPLPPADLAKAYEQLEDDELTDLLAQAVEEQSK